MLLPVGAHEKTLTGDRTKSAANDPMEVNEMKQSSRSEAEKSGAQNITGADAVVLQNCAGYGDQNGR